MTLSEKIRLLDLKPRNAPAGITTDQFGKWIRAVKSGKGVVASVAALLEIHCDALIAANKERIETKATTKSKPLFKQREHPLKKKALPVQTVAEKKTVQVPAAPPRTLETFSPPKAGMNTLDEPMTKKFRQGASGCGEAWVLYAEGWKYVLNPGKIHCNLELEEGMFRFEDFREVK
jgi:hypothetical protein